MEGINILSQKIIYNTILPEWCIVVGFVLACVCFVLTIIFFVEYSNVAGTICAVLVIVGVIIVCLSCASNKNSIDHIEYKVTIDNSVSMNKFLDKYEILGQEGKIYTVKERK